MDRFHDKANKKRSWLKSGRFGLLHQQIQQLSSAAQVED
jgi:hypothetical protein